MLRGKVFRHRSCHSGWHLHTQMLSMRLDTLTSRKRCTTWLSVELCFVTTLHLSSHKQTASKMAPSCILATSWFVARFLWRKVHDWHRLHCCWLCCDRRAGQNSVYQGILPTKSRRTRVRCTGTVSVRRTRLYKQSGWRQYLKMSDIKRVSCQTSLHPSLNDFRCKLHDATKDTTLLAALYPSHQKQTTNWYTLGTTELRISHSFIRYAAIWCIATSFELICLSRVMPNNRSLWLACCSVPGWAPSCCLCLSTGLIV